MGLISLTLPNDGETIDAADVNSPLNTIATAINGNLDNANIKTAAAIDGSKIADNSIPNTKMINAPLGWTAFANTPNTVTYNGNRNYDLVFNSVDLTSSLSPGMKLQLTRTVAAPDQCADLEASSSQYFNKTSPAGMTFTDDFTVSAWVKLESYTQGVIMGRTDTTNVNGWQVYVDSSGRLAIQGLSSPNSRTYISYASLPLNKWVHIAASLDMSGASGKTYIDGVEVSGVISGTATSLTLGASLGIGANAIGGATSNFFDGKIAQAAVFSSVLSAATIRSYMGQGLAGSESTLVSAYSLDNSLNDLNTSNANNLTAQGGAAATNADSPFANAVSAGLLEYAEINSVSFSTNTTVNVRVPDTCMIPTSGGISATSYSTQSNPYGLPYFSKLIAYAQILTNDTTGGTAEADVNGLTCVAYIPTNARVVVRAHVNTYNSSGAAFHLIRVKEGSTTYAVGNSSMVATNAVNLTTPAAYLTPSPGIHTYKISQQASGGNKNIEATISEPAYISVELV